MRVLKLLNVAILSALVGSAALVYAQDDKQQEDKPARQEEPKPKQDEAKPPKQDKEMEKQDQKHDREQSPDQAVKQKDQHPEMKGDHARPAGKGGHIPDDKFRSHFGHDHHFSARGVVVAGQPQFQYGGYTFEFVDAWPADWAYTDDCYIDYIDGGYFLFDLLHPGVRIALFVVL